MRTALLAVAALAAGGLIVPATVVAAGAADPQPAAGTRYADPSYASVATVSVTGTLTPIHSEVGEHRYGLALADGSFVPVSLARLGEDDIERPRPFTGDLALPVAVQARAESRGASIDAGDDIDGRTREGRVVLAAATTATSPLPVAAATLGASESSEPTAQATAVSPHRLYVAVITNRGTLESDSNIASKTASMRSYWHTESSGKISSFTQPDATVKFAASSKVDSSADGCGLANPYPTWSEAAAKFPGVSFNDPGNHLMVIVPDDCGANGGAGIGTVGSSLRSGGRTIVTLGSTAVAIGVHELGHNLSLHHANAEQCSSSCSTTEYWDLYSIMGLAVGGGSWTPASLDTAYRVDTGIADSAEVPTVTRTATVHLEGRGTGSGTRGLIVTDPASKVQYSAEYRSGSGRDASAFYAPGRTINNFVYRPGIVIERLEEDGSTTMITRASGGKYVTSFLAGETFRRGNVTVAVRSAAPADGADVTVTLPAPASPSASPSSAEPSTSPSTAPSNSSSASPLPTDLPTGVDPTDTGSPSDTPSGTPSDEPSSPSASPSSPTAEPPAAFTPGTPAVRGTPRVGRQLAVSPGSWSPSPSYFTAQWLANGRAIARATGARLTLTRALLGTRISVRLTAYRDGYTTTARTSAATGPVAAGRFSSRTVTITGRAKVGRTLAATTGSWNPRPSFSYRWYSNGRVLKSATGRTLKVTKSLRGKRIAVRITARQDGYVPASRSSQRTSSVR